MLNSNRHYQNSAALFERMGFTAKALVKVFNGKKQGTEEAFQKSTTWHRNSQFSGTKGSEEQVGVINISLPRLLV